MKTVRWRITFLALFLLATSVTLLTLSYLSHSDIKEFYLKKEQSYKVTLLAQQWYHLGRKKDTFLSQQIEALKKELQPPFRAEALSRLLKNNNKNNFDFVFKSESEFRRHNQLSIDYLESRFDFFIKASAASLFLFFISLLYFSFRTMITPLEKLNKKMSDFLHQKYTYEFVVPEPNEIGDLQSTFNVLAQRVLKQIEELKTLDKAKSEFLSIASHELRTPLTSIKGSLGLLGGGVLGPVNETALGLLKIATQETDRLIRIINEFLDLAKIEARQFPLKKEWYSSQDIVEKTIQSLNGFAGASQVQLKSRVDLPFEIYADVDRIQQVLTNLLSNAIKYSPPQSVVLIQVVKDESQHLCFKVIDQGRGIAPADQVLIFEKFRQATSSDNPLVKGTGLGLAIAKALVEEHGGHIGVQSTPLKGSTFYFTLPDWRLKEHSPISEAS